MSGPGGETDDHSSLLTRSSGFESWSGCSEKAYGPVVKRRRHPFDVGKSDGSSPSGTTQDVTADCRRGRATRTGDGTRLEGGRAQSLAGSTPAPSAVSVV